MSRFREARGDYLELDARVRGSLRKGVDTMYPFIRNAHGSNPSAKKYQVQQGFRRAHEV